MKHDSALRVRQLIQEQGPHRPLPETVSPETAALCVLVDALARKLDALETKLFRHQTRHDAE